ncbi:MAG: chalcone isomerase family protein [Burkholderiaceae bacterium]
MNSKIFSQHVRRLLTGWLLGATMLTGVLPTVLAAGAVAPPHIQDEMPQARLAGQGSFRWLGLKIYDAQLWVGAQGIDANAPLAAKLVLDLRYARSLQGAKIAAASKKEMQKLDLGTAQQRAIWQTGMKKIFPNVNSGSHLSGVYLPNEGVRFYLDGKFIGAIMDAEFGQAFFLIWLATNTTAPALRNALLANAAPR